MITLVEQPATIPQWPPEAPIRVTQVDDLDLLWARKAEWNALVERGATNTVFQTCEWHACWWKTLAGDARPFVLLAESAGEMVGVAPLMLSERRVLSRKRRVVEFIGARSSDYCDLIVDQRRPEVLPLLLEWLAEHDQQWDVLQLADIPETSPTLRALPAFFEQRGRLTDVRALYEAPTRIFGDPAADRQLVKKKSLRRHENYFRQHGTLEFKHAVHVEEIDAYLDIFFQQHIQRRALTDTPSQFLDDRQQAFYRELVRLLAPTRWLLFSVVLFNQAPIAFHFGFEYGNRFIWYKPSFDVAYFKHSPGEVLIKNLLEYVLERNLAEFDFTIGEEAFKYRFANHVRLNYAVHVFRHPLPYHVNRLLLDTKAFVKRSPAFIRLGRWLIRRWPSL